MNSITARQVRRIKEYLKDMKEHTTSDIVVNCGINHYRILGLMGYLESKNQVVRRTTLHSTRWKLAR